MCQKNIFISEKNKGRNSLKQKFCTRYCLFIKNILALVLLKNIIIFRYWQKNDFLVQTLGVVFTPLNRFSADKKIRITFFNPL